MGNTRLVNILGQDASTRISPNAMGVLLLLIRHRGDIVTREEICALRRKSCYPTGPELEMPAPAVNQESRLPSC